MVRFALPERAGSDAIRWHWLSETEAITLTAWLVAVLDGPKLQEVIGDVKNT